MSRVIGDEFEEELAEALGLKKTANSGAMFDDGDLRSRQVILEAKVKNNNKSLGGCASELKKLKTQAKKFCIDWIYAQKTQSGSYVVLDLEYFKELWEKANLADQG